MPSSAVTAWSAIVALSNQEDMEPDFNLMADCLMAMGLSAAAALSRSWSLIPPKEEVWRQALRSWTQKINGSESVRSSGSAEQIAWCSSNLHPTDLQDRLSLNQQLENVQNLVDSGSLKQASEQLAQIAYQQKLPSNLCNRVAMLKEQEQDFWQAECWYRTSLKSVREQPLAWFGLAATLLAQNAADEALEASSVGLQFHPTHPWGLKLQQRALTALGATCALQRLEAESLLPLAIDNGLLSSDQVPATQYVKASKISLQGKLAIANLLPPDKPIIWLIGLEAPDILLWLEANQAIPGAICLQSFGSPDVDAKLSASGSQFSLVCESDRPYYWINHMSSLPDLAIVAESHAKQCNRALQRVMQGNTVSILACQGFVELPESIESLQLSSQLVLFRRSDKK